ncbi:MAG: CHAT domain-containing tetratricopeptide repeat protein [Pseudomonadota bacterium]
MMASPAAAQYFDIYGEANRALPEAQKGFDALTPDAPADDRARAVSDLIIALIGKAKYKEAYELYLENRELALHPDAVAGAVGHGLVAFVEDEAIRADYTARLLATVEQESCAPCYARTFSAHHLARYFYNIEDDVAKSVEWHKRALDLAKEDLAPNDPARVNFAFQYAGYLRNLDLEAAAVAVRETEAMALKLLPRDDHLGWLYVFLNNALVALDRGRIAEAADLFSRIADIGVKEWGESDPQLLGIYQNIAVLRSRLGQTDQAVAIALRALENETYSNEADLGYHRGLIARLMVQDERPGEAVDYFRLALTHFEGLEDQTFAARARMDLGNALSLLGEHEEAMTLAKEAIPVFRAKLEISNAQRRERETLAARIYARGGDVGLAAETINAVIAGNEGVLLDIYARDQDRRALASDGSALFRDSMAISLLDGDPARAWRSAQLALISDLTLSAKALTYPGDAAGFSSALEDVSAARAAEDEARVKLASGEANAEALATARAAREAAQAALERDYPDFAQFVRPQPLTIAQAQRLLRADEAFILPVVFEDRVVTIAVTREGLSWGAAETAPFEGRSLISRLRASLDAELVEGDGFDAEAAHTLYTLIFTPDVIEATGAKAKFIFPAGGALARIPASVLLKSPAKDGESPHFLIRDHAVAITPSLGSTARERSKPARRFAGVGAPSLGPAPATRSALRGAAFDIQSLASLPSLPGALVELEALQSAFAGEDTLLLTGDAATEGAVREADLSAYQVLAFATHGLVSGQIEGLSEPALVMTPMALNDASDNDGLLTASEIANLTLAADWIILSACNTAAGDGRGSATYGGLARAFQLAGARSLLLSHWPVRDDAATRLSVFTVRASASGMERSQALRAAQLALIEDESVAGGASPSVWAPFVIVE